MADPKITITGVDQGDLVQLLFEVVYNLIAQTANTGISASDFTVDIVGKVSGADTVAGKNQS